MKIFWFVLSCVMSVASTAALADDDTALNDFQRKQQFDAIRKAEARIKAQDVERRRADAKAAADRKRDAALDRLDKKVPKSKTGNKN